MIIQTLKQAFRQKVNLNVFKHDHPSCENKQNLIHIRQHGVDILQGLKTVYSTF